MAAFALVLSAALAVDPAADLVGKPAPPLEGETLDGRALKLDDLRGKVVVLQFWAVWCQPCRESLAALRELAERRKGRGVEVLGVTRSFGRFTFDKKTGRLGEAEPPLAPEQERAMLRDFAAYHRLGFPLLALEGDAAGRAFAAYGASRLPLTVLLDRRGAVRLVKVGAGKETSEAIDRVLEDLLREKDER
jgi:peroxiredoxin